MTEKLVCMNCRHVHGLADIIDGKYMELWECGNYKCGNYGYVMLKNDTCPEWEAVPEPKEEGEPDMFGFIW